MLTVFLVLVSKSELCFCVQSVVVFLQWLISFLVPDTPRAVKMQILREKHLAKESILAAEVMRRDHLGGASTSSKSPAAQRHAAGSFPSEQPLY